MSVAAVAVAANFLMLVPNCARCGHAMESRIYQRADGVWDFTWYCARHEPPAPRDVNDPSDNGPA